MVSMIKRNNTLSKPLTKVESSEEEVDFGQRRQTKRGDQNDQEIEKLKSDILSTKKLVNSYTSEAQQAQVIEYSKTKKRKTEQVPFSDISELSRSSFGE